MYLYIWVIIHSALFMRTNTILSSYLSHFIEVNIMLAILCRLGQACNHIAALLFFIEHHSNAEDLPTEVSKTTKPMAWNQPPKKSVTPECSSNMRFVKPSYGYLPLQRISRSTFDSRAVEHQGDVEKERVDHFIPCIRESMPCSGLQHIWCDGPNSESNPGDVSLWSHVLFLHGSLNSTINKIIDLTPIDCQWFLLSIKLLSTEVEAIEAATRDQSCNALWQTMRNGRLTSSRFGEILKHRQTTDSQRLVKDIMGYKGPMMKVPPQIRWGKNNKDRAYKLYIEDRQRCGEDMEVEASGLHLMADRSLIGASSDGKVLCRNVDTCNRGCLEIKCPYSINGHITVSMTPTEIAEKHPENRSDDGLLHLPHDHAYYAQVQGEMALLDVEWCDFVVFSNYTVLVDRIMANYDYWMDLLEKLEQFYLQHVIPELLSGKILQELGKVE